MYLLYFGSVFMAAVLYLLMAVVLFLQRKEGERSRVILAGLILVSLFNYSTRITSLLQGETPALLVSVPMLIVGLFMIISYIIYPVEVISPGWITWKRLLRMYSPIGILVVIYWITLKCGVTYTPYGNLISMLPHIDQFDVWFRLLLCLMAFLPLLFILLPKYTRKYNNTNNNWIRRYVVVFFVNTAGYIWVMTVDDMWVKAAYYFISVGCELYLVYQELFVRLISLHAQEVHKVAPVVVAPEPGPVTELRHAALFAKLEAFIHQEHTWRDPDFTLVQMAIAINSNRTDLINALREQGYEGYSDYINRLRIDEFIQLAQKYPMSDFQDLFFEVGYRSKTTALRNFRQYYSSTPSEYFQQEMR